MYYDGESVGGSVLVRVKDGKRVQHDGIRIELVGSIGAFRILRTLFGGEATTLPVLRLVGRGSGCQTLRSSRA